MRSDGNVGVAASNAQGNKMLAYFRILSTMMSRRIVATIQPAGVDNLQTFPSEVTKKQTTILLLSSKRLAYV